ncbi:MAG: acyl-CoA synthetase [Haloarculaceae archaeon]
MTAERLDAYHFYEQDWDSYEQLYDAFEWEVPETFNIAAYACDRWADDKGRVALFGETPDGDTETYTFWQVRNAANQLANYLREQGVERGDRVGINAPQRPETAISHLAIWKLGAVSVPLSTLFGPDAIQYRLDDAGAVAAVVDESNVENFREARDDLDDLDTLLALGDVTPRDDEAEFWSAIGDQSRSFDTVSTDADDDALLIYTSGTTGNPKGVRHAHHVLLGHLTMFVTGVNNMEMSDADVYWTPSEWAWIASLFNILFTGLFFGRPVVANNTGPFDPEEAFEMVEKYGITGVFMPPTALRMMMQVEDPGQYDVDSLDCIVSGGESLGQTIVEWANDVFSGTAVHEGYGQTEANMLVGECEALIESREGSMGVASLGQEVTILDAETAEETVEPGEVGEIAVRPDTPVHFKEYWNKPEKTESKFANGWMLTEDLGTVDEDGYFTFVSRKDDVIISAGYRIGPEEVEDSVAGHEAVADAAVIGVPDDERGEVPKAFVVLADGYEASEELQESIRQHVRDRLAKYEYPREFEFLDELPKTETGKVRRTSLREDE